MVAAAVFLPALLFYVYVMIVPSVQGAAFAFTDWDGLSPNWDWIGLSNFERLFNDPQAMRDFGTRCSSPW